MVAWADARARAEGDPRGRPQRGRRGEGDDEEKCMLMMMPTHSLHLFEDHRGVQEYTNAVHKVTEPQRA